MPDALRKWLHVAKQRLSAGIRKNAFPQTTLPGLESPFLSESEQARRCQSGNIAFHTALDAFLFGSSLLYSKACSVHRSLYRYGFLKQTRLPVPLISVGNITWGGNGKTPMVEYIARRCLDDAVSVPPLILTRGYGGGDEVRLFQKHFEGSCIALGVGKNRPAIASRILQQRGVRRLEDRETITSSHADTKSDSQSGTSLEPPLGVAILDDGLQHYALVRDLEVVIISAVTLWGNGRLLPAGPMREAVTALQRADVVVIHHANLISETHLASLSHNIKAQCRHSTLHLHTAMTAARITPIAAFLPASPLHKNQGLRSLPVDILRDAVVLSVSGIGCPESLHLALQDVGAGSVASLSFPDHHNFKHQDMERIESRLQQLTSDFPSSQVLLILSEKDAMRDPCMFHEHLAQWDPLVLCSELRVLGNAQRVAFDTILMNVLRGPLRKESLSCL